MLNNCDYDKIKMLHELSSIAWFLGKHALSDANKVGCNDCCKIFEDLKQDLQKHIKALNDEIKK